MPRDEDHDGARASSTEERETLDERRRSNALECRLVDDYVDGLPSQAGRFQWTALGGSRTEDILKGGTLLVNDTSTGPHTAAEREALQAAGIGAYICPLLVKDGRFVGSFGIHSREPRVWTPDEIALVQDVADRIWTTLEHRKADAELRANEERLVFLLRLNDALGPLSDPGEVQTTAARFLAQHLGATRVGYAEVDRGEYKIYREYAQGVGPLAGQSPDIILSEEMRAALRRGETVVVHDVQTDPRLSDSHRATLQTRQVAAFIATTLLKNGQLVAVFGANHLTPRVWTPSEVELVHDVAARTWDAVERTRAEAVLREQKQRLGVALEASAGGSWTWVAATNQVDWDERFRALYGFAPDDPATPDAWMPRVHDDDRPRMLASLDEILTSTTRDSWENTFRIVRPDGTVAYPEPVFGDWRRSVGRGAVRPRGLAARQARRPTQKSPDTLGRDARGHGRTCRAASRLARKIPAPDAILANGIRNRWRRVPRGAALPERPLGTFNDRE